MFKFSSVGYGKAVVLAVTVEGISRTRMQGGYPVAVGMGREATLSRARCRRVGPLALPPRTRTSHTLWVRTAEPDNQ